MRFRRPDGRNARLVLGGFDATKRKPHPKPEIGADLTLVEARLLAGRIHHERASGADVISERKAMKLKQRLQIFLNTVSSILGDYAAVAAMDALTVAIGERHTTDIAMLHGARLVTASETEEGRAWAEARIKHLTGGDPITARFMRENNFTFLPTFKLMIVGNHKPTLHNVDEAARRRFNIVPFTRMPATPDPKLEAKLRAEAAGILRWMIVGCRDWQANGLQRPQSVVEATEEYFSNQDTLGQWLDEQCDVEPGNRWKNESSAALFKSWQAYAISAGAKAGSRTAFADAMEKRGLERDKGAKGARLYRGVCFKPNDLPFNERNDD